MVKASMKKLLIIIFAYLTIFASPAIAGKYTPNMHFYESSGNETNWWNATNINNWDVLDNILPSLMSQGMTTFPILSPEGKYAFGFAPNIGRDNSYGRVQVYSEIMPAPATTAGYPLGNDLVLKTQGPADLRLGNIPLDIICSTTVTTGSSIVTVSSTTQLSGPSQYQTIQIDPDTANDETLPYYSWSIVDNTHLQITFGKPHTAPFIIRQSGIVSLDARRLQLNGADISDRPLTLIDKNINIIAKLPNDVGGSFPENAIQLNTVLTGMNSSTGNLLIRNATAQGFIGLINSDNSRFIALFQDSGITIGTTYFCQGDNFQDLLTSIGTFNRATIIINSDIVTKGTITVPANISIVVWQGGSFSRDPDGSSIQFNGPFSAGLYHVFFGFSNSGDWLVKFGNSSVSEIYPQWWGAKGDGITNDASAFASAVLAYSRVFLPSPLSSYLIGAPITVPASTTLIGANWLTTKCTLGFNGDMFNLGEGARIEDVWLEGNGASYAAGRGIVMTSSNGRQVGKHLKVWNFNGPCIYFATTSGSQSFWEDLNVQRYNGAIGDGRYSIVISPDGDEIPAYPRKFFNVEGNNVPTIDFGGGSDIHLFGGYLGDLHYGNGGNQGRGVNITGARLAGSPTLTMWGFNHSIVGCDIYPQITLALGSNNNTIGPGSFNQYPPVIDNSQFNFNKIYHEAVVYTPTWTNALGDSYLGNGTITGSFAKLGTSTEVTINFTVGSTTNFGTESALRFGLPLSRYNTDTPVCGTALITHGASVYTAIVYIQSGIINFCTLYRDAGIVTGKTTNPAALTTGDTINMTFTYNN